VAYVCGLSLVAMEPVRQSPPSSMRPPVSRQPGVGVPQVQACRKVSEAKRVQQGERLAGAILCDGVPAVLAWAVASPIPAVRYGAPRLLVRLKIREAELVQEALSDGRGLMSDVSVDVTARTSRSISYVVSGTIRGTQTTSAFSELLIGQEVIVVRISTRPPLALHGVYLRKMVSKITVAFMAAHPERLR
jgi:hypothetical protein